MCVPQNMNNIKFIFNQKFMEHLDATTLFHLYHHYIIQFPKMNPVLQYHHHINISIGASSFCFFMTNPAAIKINTLVDMVSETQSTRHGVQYICI